MRSCSPRTPTRRATPLLLLRAAAHAAELDVELSPASAARLVRECPELPDPWPDAARQLFVRLLASGPGLRAVWDTLEETGALDRVLPEWERIRMLPHASVIHRFTVDRHLVETCVEASTLIRHVGRPDVLMVAALLHDIGKGELTEHSVAGEPIARAIARRIGFDERSVDLVGTLVRWHLLLAETASARDPDDPETVRRVTERVADLEALNLLRALTEADARATAPKAWSTWRASLIDIVGRRAAEALGGEAAPTGERLPWAEVEVPKAVRKGASWIDVELVEDGARVTVLSPDRLGLLADVAALFATQRASVRAARAWTQGDTAVSVWDIARRAPRPRRPAPALRGDRDRSPGPGRPAPPLARRRSRADGRRTVGRLRAGHRAGGHARPTARASSTSSAPPWPPTASRSGRHTSTPSAPRPSTCSTCRRRAPASSATTAPPRPPTPSARPSPPASLRWLSEVA